MPAKRKRTPRDHDAAIAALRREALVQVKYAEIGEAGRRDNGTASYRRLRGAAFSYAADYLASITGKVERAAKRPR